MRSIVVIGAGVIGAAVGWRCAQRGLDVTLVDPQPERGAWHTAAGMLSPVTELHYGEERLFALGIESLARFAGFCAELSAATGLDPHLTTCGTISTAWDAADLAGLRDLHAFGRTLGARAEFLTAGELRAMEPSLAPGLTTGGVFAPDDHVVEPRQLHRALLAAAAGAGARFVTDTAAVHGEGGRVTGVVTADGTVLAADEVVLAAGAWSGVLDGLAPELRPPVRPVKGQTLVLRPALPVLSHVVRASIKGAPVYLVPRDNGDVVVGASVEEADFDVRPRAGAVYDLLRDAQTAVPELAEAELVEVNTGLRPGSPDNAPILGPSGLDGLTYACGHHRNGILLTPITADAIADFLVTGTVAEEIEPFAVTRFADLAAT
jgi:glycine oxidase